MNIVRPSLLIDLDKVKRNISRIAAKGAATNTQLIPHFKTHQSLMVGEIFKEYGIDSITVSSFAMAKYFADAGWRSIYVAFPLNLREIQLINLLAEQVDLTVLINELEQLRGLKKLVKKSVKVKIEIECGSNRSGVEANDLELFTNLLEETKDSIHTFDGFYSHFGHTYKAISSENVKEIFNESIKILHALAEEFAEYGPKVSTGDTPAASAMQNYANIASIHAGNYVFYDLTQAQIGICSEDDIAIALAAPVVSKNKDRKELVLHGGGIHLSKESMQSQEFGTTIFGKLVKLTDQGWSESLDDCYLRALSQEHGIAKVSSKIYDEINVGDVLGVLPVHSCMTADCMRQYIDLQGNRIDHLQGLAI